MASDPPGQSLDELCRAPMEIGGFLRLAIRITDALADLHRGGVTHKDIKPHNIFIQRDTGLVRITNLDVASRLPQERPSAKPPSAIEGTLAYMSPEQTGRANRWIDDRTDLYSLGVTFYEMLTGKLPFEARDALEWIHAHLAHTPPSPCEAVPEVPEAIARIILKLLSKTADDRYQSARGLRRDLERCLEQWSAHGKIEPFPLAQRDVPDQFQIPQKLYGREGEVAELLSAFERVVGTGSPELVLVSGYSGIGKSALVHELYKPIVRERGFFISGKFDQYKRDIPYSTIVQAFRELVLEILTESEERIATWRQRLLDALGINGQLIVDVIPQVELVIGRQPPVAELPPIEAQNRFRTVFRHFIGVFARKEHPLALFLDDLQWADLASLGLLEDLMTHPETGHLLVIGAYRDNEVPPSHSLVRARGRVRKEGARVSDIVLGPLSREHLATLVSGTLHCRREDAEPLSGLIHEKTAGNPFFAIQFLTAIHEEHLIEFDWRAGAFRWDVARIREKGFTDNVVDLMVGKLARLPAVTQEALKTLACLGNTAEVAVLAAVRGRSEAAAHADLWPAAAAGLVIRLDGAYKFLHDRVQEAAYSLIPEGERAAAHLEIGRLLLSRTAAEELEEKIFEIVNQLDRGAPLITSREERERVAELDLIAGKRAKRSTAYASALTYLAAGSALLETESWGRRYPLTFALEFHRAECEFLTGDLAAADERLSMLSGCAANLIDLAAVTGLRVNLFTSLARSDRSVEVTLQYLQRLGIEWSPHPTKEEVQREFERIWQQLGSRSIEELVDLPPMRDAGWSATMDVLTAVIPATCFTDENLLCLVTGRMVNLSLEHGNSDASCIGYAFLGPLLGPRFGDYQAGFRFGKLGVDLVDKRGLDRLKARVYLHFANLVSPWTRHMRNSTARLRHSFAMANKMGDLSYAVYSCNHLVTNLLAIGEPLGEVHRDAEAGLDFARKARFGLIVDIITSQLLLIRSLRGLTPEFSSFDDDQFSEGQFERHLEEDPRLAIAACWYWIRKLQARLFANDYASAVEAASKAQRLIWTSTSHVELAEYHFYGALARAAYYGAVPAEERPQYSTELAAHRGQLDEWAKSCPENFEHRAALVAAENARIGGEAEKAEHLYEEAIRSAREHGFVNDEAIAYETAARFYRARGFELIADTSLREALARYLRWGADGKARHLDLRHPGLLESKPPLAPTATFAVRSEQLDLLSVTKASQTISSEMVLDKLVRTLLTVVLEQGGARRACLILCQGGSLSIEAEASLEERGVATKILEAQPLSSSPLVPVSIVNYVMRTKERVILEGAADASKYASDPYIARVKPRSLLCLPILRQAEVVGLLYLENDLVAGAFTPERLAALSLLASQAAISLQNALLLTKEQAARAAAEEAERRAAFLAGAGALLAESLDYHETLARLGRLCVQSLCDWCMIDVVEGGEIRRVSGAHKDPAKESLLEELLRRYPPRWKSPHPAVRVLRTGEPFLLSDASGDVLRQYVEEDEHATLIRELGTQSAISVPLVARGQTLGVLSISSSAPGHRYGSADLELVQEVARRAAMAIDNARLYREAQETARIREDFVAIASPELCTPLTPLKLQLQLVDSVLDVSRVAEEQVALELEEVDLPALVRATVDRFQALLVKAGSRVELRADPGVTGRWDRLRIEQVVVNLLSNAIKFGLGRPIDISVVAAGGMAILSVQDHGLGKAEDRERVFGRFERVSGKSLGGLGLGLYVARKIVEAHGGVIRLASDPGAGSCFTVELPRG